MLNKLLYIIILFLLLPPILASSLDVSPTSVNSNEDLQITVNPDNQGIYKFYYIYPATGDVEKHVGAFPYPEDIGYTKETVNYQIPSDWETGNYYVAVYSYSIGDIGDWIKEYFEVSQPTCEDGTLVGQCSTDKPKYCDVSGSLIDNCIECECPSGYECQKDGSCIIICSEFSEEECIQNEYCEPIYEKKRGGLLGLLLKERYEYKGCIQATCSDRKKNQDEENIDCGGSCAPCIYCLDNTLSGQCSSVTIGKYCNNVNNTGILVDDCQMCGCPSGYSCQADGSCILFCSDGTLAGKCSVDKPKYCDNSGSLIDNYCYGPDLIVGTADDCGCPSGYSCQADGSCVFGIPIAPNAKSMSKYSSKEVFLISDREWKNVLLFVPVAIWTEGTSIKKYPILIYHKELNSFDGDSIIYFLQQYNPSKVTIIGGTPQELDNLLITSPTLGAGLQPEDIQRISINDYSGYWESFDTLVYVENNYELALLASTYASLINAPLIIKGTTHDSAEIFTGRSVICVGSVSPVGSSCSEHYTLEQLRQKYKSETNTDKVILVNPNDWTIAVGENFLPGKSWYIYNLYTKTSLVAPILASAKHELILSTTETDYRKIDRFLESWI